MSKSPLGDNTNWVVNSDRHYTSRELDQATHDMLALVAVSFDPELMCIEDKLGERVIVGIRLGKRTLHIRVYSRRDVEEHPDAMASRSAYPDTDAYVIFDVTTGYPKLIDGDLRMKAQAQRPMIYGDRRLNSERVLELDQIQAIFLKHLPPTSAMALTVAMTHAILKDKPVAPLLEPAA